MKIVFEKSHWLYILIKVTLLFNGRIKKINNGLIRSADGQTDRRTYRLNWTLPRHINVTLIENLILYFTVARICNAEFTDRIMSLF
jgi:hypothetical protein